MPPSIPPLCQFHEQRLSVLELGVRAANDKLDRLVAKLAPEQQTVEVSTKWGHIKGSAPWVLALAFIAAALLTLHWSHGWGLF
jgi:hypothetical protein